MVRRGQELRRKQVHKQTALLTLPVNYFGFCRYYKNLCMIMKTSLKIVFITGKKELFYFEYTMLSSNNLKTNVSSERNSYI